MIEPRRFLRWALAISAALFAVFVFLGFAEVRDTGPAASRTDAVTATKYWVSDESTKYWVSDESTKYWVSDESGTPEADHTAHEVG